MHPLAPTLYGFSNTKVAALKSKMLSKEFYRSALSVKSVEAIIELLRDTPYSEYIREAKDSRDVGRASYRRIAFYARLLKKYVPKKDVALYDAFLMRYEFMNARKVLSALAKGLEFEEIASQLHSVGLPISFWKRAMENLQILSPFAKVKEVSIENLPEIMEQVDASFVASQRPLASTKAYEFIVKDVDITNLLSLMSRKGGAKFRIEGAIPLKKLEEARKKEKVRAELLRSFGLDPEMEIPEAQMSLELRYARKKRAAFYSTVFSLDKVLLFLMMLEEEARNLKKLAVSKDLGIPSEKVEEVLVL